MTARAFDWESSPNQVAAEDNNGNQSNMILDSGGTRSEHRSEMVSGQPELHRVHGFFGEDGFAAGTHLHTPG
jgi:hypothetical protein